ncbi:aspartate/glutamate racemase family protein [Ahrensia sp. R2A130]|uniref:aspartate/glutamate racemase family protein n=1 Tax=Ahrensia sp. R2A130 TaxID=744979 RepID=UPI0001E09CB6|nr:aspartate/glutamate racemase family protein [Ahrensia sp. R2A130]EFL88206.1 hydantoin racemase [Ahrensia sp. R2A130]
MGTRILLINPNSTASMTAEIAYAARLSAAPNTTIRAVNPDAGPPSIQGAMDGTACLPHLFSLFDRETAAENFDCVIIACFDDTGLQTLKARSPIPVLGIGESAFHLAALLGGKFATVTTLPVSVPIIEANIEAYGFTDHSVGVRASNVPVLSVGKDTEAAIAEEVGAAVTEDDARSVILGCAGMASLASRISKDLGVPVIDGVMAAVGFAEQLTRLKAA